MDRERRSPTDGGRARELPHVDVEATPEGGDGSGAEAFAWAVHQGVAELRRANALVVAWVRLVLALLAVGFRLTGSSIPGAQLTPSLPGHLAYLALACLAAVLLHRRWRVTAVAFATSAVDVTLMAVAIDAVARPGSSPGAPIGYIAGILLLLILFGAVALPPRMAVPVMASVAALQLLLGVRAGVPGSLQVVATLCACAFAAVVLWANMRMVKLAAGMAVTRATASMAERHAHELEAAHAEISAQRDRLVAAHNEAEALTQVIVHDLKNPLATMLQYVSFAEAELKAAPGTSGAVDYLEHASSEGRRLSKLIGDLLLVYRLERGAMAPAREQVPVKLLFQSVARRYRPRAAERGAALEVDAGEELVISVDLDLAQRMLENLVANALRHVGQGDRVRLDAHAADGNVLLAVRNSGPPVAPELRDRLFGRFVTGGQREWSNAGLGLYLCRLVAEAHGGSIALVDAPGWNVSFEVTLPLSAAPGPEAPAVRVSAAP